MDPSDIDERFDNLESLILEKGEKIESLEKLITAIEGQIDDEEYHRIQFKKNIEKLFRTLKQVASKTQTKIDYDLRYETAPGPKDTQESTHSPRGRRTPRSRRNSGRLKKRRTMRVANKKRSKNKRKNKYN